MQVTVTLPEETYRRAKRLAQLTHREVADVLADALSLSLPSLAEGRAFSIQEIADEQVLALTRLQLTSEEDARLSTLLDGQQADELADEERAELNRLMQVYQEGLLLKSEALAEAVSRGLIPPLVS